MTALFIYSYEGPVHMFLFLLKTVAIKVLIEIINSGSVSRGSGVQVSPVTPKHPILGIGKVSSDLSLSLIERNTLIKKWNTISKKFKIISCLCFINNEKR